jgi:hypothetical protein
MNMMTNKKFDYLIGIDPGVKTGIAIWDCNENKFILIDSYPITIALLTVNNYRRNHIDDSGKWGDNIAVVVEDARQRKWFGNKGREALQGAGSIKRDCQIWEEFLKEFEIDYKMQAPSQGMTKLNAEQFRKLMGYSKRTNEHARDAAMLIYGKKKL